MNKGFNKGEEAEEEFDDSNDVDDKSHICKVQVTSYIATRWHHGWPNLHLGSGMLISLDFKLDETITTTTCDSQYILGASIQRYASASKSSEMSWNTHSLKNTQII